MASKVCLLSLLALSLFVLAACGHVTFGSTNTAATSPTFNDWQYGDQSWPGGDPAIPSYRLVSSPSLTEAQAALYKELSRDLSDTLAAYQQVGVIGYRHVWPILADERIKRLSPSYDSNNQMLSWNYENIGDCNLDGIVNSLDLFPIARFADAPFSINQDELEYRNWLDADGDGKLDRYNAQQIGMSYGRQVFGYNVLAGDGADPAGMELIGLVPTYERMPDWPPHFELLVPVGSNFLCIQPLDSFKRVICSYVANLIGKPDHVSVLYPDQVEPTTR